MNKKANMIKSLKLSLLILFSIVLMTMLLLAFGPNKAKASADGSEIDYTFEDVPIENIEIKTDPSISEIKPGESFCISYELSPWYTTADRIYVDVSPIGVADVSDIDAIKVKNGRAFGTALITVSPTAKVGSEFTVTASSNDVESNEISLTVAKIPVEQIKLSYADFDDKLHIGRSKQISCEVYPQTATNKKIRYELSGSGAQYVKSFDNSTGTITAISDISNVQADSTIIVTAFSEDNPSVSDSIVVSIFVPTTDVELSASTPLGGKTSDNITLAVASSVMGETVRLSATVNGVSTTGLNYVIVKGREYIENGLIHSDGSFNLKPTNDWTESMRQPHAEIRVRAAYSDGFDEIGISVYVPVEQISFVQDNVPSNVENNRKYDLSVKAIPDYATFLNDCSEPFLYTLNGLDKNIASVNNDGILSLPKSITSKGSVINYTAYFNGAWDGVDVDPFDHTMSVVPVVANDITQISIKKDGVSITDPNNPVKVLPDDILDVEVEFDKDNVTELSFDLIEDSLMLSTANEKITIAGLGVMTEDNPYIQVVLKYNGEFSEVTKQIHIPIYVPAMTADIRQVQVARDKDLNLTPLVTINGHGYASDKTITWGSVKINNQNVSSATCVKGMLHIDSKTNAGAKVTVAYKTCDNDNWLEQTFTVAPLENLFTLSYTKDRNYTINPDAPQLEEGYSIGLLLAYNGLSGKNFGLTYTLSSTKNSKITENTGNRNSGYDEFILSAHSGQSGRNNYIGYLIEIKDGTSTYHIGTSDFGHISPAGTYMKNIAIFNRINTEVTVSNISIEEGQKFNLSGWDELATFDKSDLSWTIDGNEIKNMKLEGTHIDNLLLIISATQSYNKITIPFSAAVAFYSIVYKSESDEIMKITYKKAENTILLSTGLNEGKQNFAQTGWSKSKSGGRDFALGSEYSEDSNLILYAYWHRTVVDAPGGEVFQTDRFLPEDFCEWTEIDDITDCFNSFTSIDALKSVGYTKVTVSMDVHVVAFGNMEMYLQIYDVTSDKELGCSEKYRSPNGDTFDTTYVYTFDISDIDNSHKISMRFSGRRYMWGWGGGVTLSDRSYTVRFE